MFVLDPVIRDLSVRSCQLVLDVRFDNHHSALCPRIEEAVRPNPMILAKSPDSENCPTAIPTAELKLKNKTQSKRVQTT